MFLTAIAISRKMVFLVYFHICNKMVFFMKSDVFRCLYILLFGLYVLFDSYGSISFTVFCIYMDILVFYRRWVIVLPAES